MSNSQEDKIWQQIKDTGLLGAHPVVFLETTESTNSVALELGRKGVSPGTIVVAEGQTAGRGRLSRRWISPKGAGLYFSLILRPRLDPEDLPKITIAAGVAICKALERETSKTPKIKWPNDIIFDGKKCSGILTETDSLTSSDAPLVVLGVGINISTPVSAFPADLKDKVTSLSAVAGSDYPRGKLLHSILLSLDEELKLLEAGGFQSILAAWRNRDAIGKTPLTWVTPAGSTVKGISLGPDARGFLHIRDEQGNIHEVLSGDINLLK